MESALPERVHQCEARQANHIEILNGFANNAGAQIATLQHRMNQVEQAQINLPTFGGGSAPPRSSNFDVPNSSTHQRFNIGSPISDTFQARTNEPAPSFVPPAPPGFGGNMPQNSAHQMPAHAPTSDPWASPSSRQGAPPARSFNPRDWNVSDKKVSKALTLFKGHAQNYRNWADRMMDHCKEMNGGYGQIFVKTEASQFRIPNSNLSVGQLDDGTTVDSKWLSQHLWAFIGENIDNDLHGRRMALAQNDADNGFELWRALYIENDGGRTSDT